MSRICSRFLIIALIIIFLPNLAYATDSKEWNVEGNIKVSYVNYDYNNPLPGTGTINKGHKDSNGFYTTPKVSITSPTYNNFSFKTTLAGVTDFGINNSKDESRTFAFDGTDNESFGILQEFYLNYKNSNHNFTLGRYELETPLLEPDDYYLLADSYETASYINTSIKNISLHLGYVHKMSGVWDSGANGTEFHSVADTSFVDSRDKNNAKNNGIIYGALEYKKESYKLKFWEYYVTDLYNIFLAQYDLHKEVNTFSYDVAFQYTNYKEIGKLATNNFTNIDYSIYALKFDGKFSNGFDFATGISKFTDGEGIGETLSAWGGFPTFTYGYIYNWFETGSLRNTSIGKIQLGYDLSKLGLQNSWIGYRYTQYNLDSKYAQTASGDLQDTMRLNGIRFKYTPDKGIYFIGNYEHRTLSNEPNSSAYRLIAGYKF